MNSLTKNSPEAFGEEYYRTGNYADYLERGPRYHQIAVEIDQLFQMLNLCGKDSWIIDYGCGVGFLCKSLEKLGYSQVYGWDTSTWAMENPVEGGITIFNGDIKTPTGTAIAMIALDVFEHMEDRDIVRVLESFKPYVLIVRMPIAVEGGPSFALEISRKDKTHINCKTKLQWIWFLERMGFKTVLRLNMRTIYDSEGVACLLAIRM